VRKADNRTTILCGFMNSGNFNFVEPSVLLQACKGTALPLTFYISRGSLQCGFRTVFIISFLIETDFSYKYILRYLCSAISLKGINFLFL